MSHILHIEESEVEQGAPVTADIYRFEPGVDNEPRMERYVVPYQHRMSIFTLLREIYEHQDETLAFRNQQCGRGICGTCRVRAQIDGNPEKSVKGCTIPLQPGTHVVIRPSSEKRLVRDVVVNF